MEDVWEDEDEDAEEADEETDGVSEDGSISAAGGGPEAEEAGREADVLSSEELTDGSSLPSGPEELSSGSLLSPDSLCPEESRLSSDIAKEDGVSSDTEKSSGVSPCGCSSSSETTARAGSSATATVSLAKANSTISPQSSTEETEACR